MDISAHAILTPSQVESAHQIFNSFADTSIGVSSHPTHMSISAVLQYLGILGIQKTENEVKDFVLSLTQPDVKAFEASVDVAVPQPRRTSSPSVASNKGNRKRSSIKPIPVQITPVQPPLDPSATATLLLSFEAFLSLTLFTFNKSDGGDCDKIDEIEDTFKSFDSDKDGCISLQDVRNLITSSFIEPYCLVAALGPKSARSHKKSCSPVIDFAKLSTAQIESILAELDVNNDGAVMLEDFISAIDTS